MPTTLLERETATDFVTIDDVPIFMEHSTQARDGSPMVFTRRELEGIVATCNQRYSAGLPAAVIIGHTSDFDTEEKEAIGFVGPYKLARLPSGKWGIYATLQFRREHADAMKRYPRVSVELWPDEDLADSIIDPVCLIGGSVPRLDLPGVKFRRRGDRLRYSLSPGIVQELLSVVQGTKEWAFLQSLLERATVPGSASPSREGDEPRAEAAEAQREGVFGPWHKPETDRSTEHIDGYDAQRESVFGQWRQRQARVYPHLKTEQAVGQKIQDGVEREFGRYARPGRPISFDRLRPPAGRSPMPEASRRALEACEQAAARGERPDYSEELRKAGGPDPAGQPAFP